MEQREKKQEQSEQDLEKLPTGALLKAFSRCEDKHTKDKICRVILQRDTSSWYQLSFVARID